MRSLKFVFGIMLILCLIVNSISFVNAGLNETLDVEVETVNDVMIRGLDKPAVFNLEVSNSGDGGKFRLYNLLGYDMTPRDSFYVGENKTEEIEMIVFPRQTLDDARYLFTYYIRTEDGSDRIELQKTLRILSLGDVFKIGAEDFDSNENSIEIYIENKEKIDFEDVKVKFSSNFFEVEKNFSLEGEGREQFTIELDKENYKQLFAGFYTLTAEIEAQNLTDEIKGVIKFVENNDIDTEKENRGFLVSTLTITKTNNGNTVDEITETISKGIISRLFTTFSPEPDIVNRKRGTVYYTWNSELNPGEELEIKVKTNWIFPLIVIILLVVIVVLVKQYKKTDVVLKKKVSFVNAKGGEFALRVTLKVSAKKYVEKISITDRLPKMVKLFNKFGVEEPKVADDKKGIIRWEYEKLEPGEVRVLSYIIYSKVGVFGKFALPSANAIYERDGKIKESNSNNAYFVSEQSGKEEE